MRNFSIFTLAAALALCLTLTPVAAAGVSDSLAQQDANETETDTAPTVGMDTGIDVNNETYAQEIDPTLRLVEWDYSDGEFRLVFEADRSATITITEAVQFKEGAGSGRIYSQRVPSGTTAVTVPVERRAGQAAVTMTTRRSIDRNSYSFVSTGQTQSDKPPISYERAQLLIAATGIGAAGFTFRMVRKKREDETKECEKIL